MNLERGYRTYTSSVAPSTTRAVLWIIILNVVIFILQRVFLDRYLRVFGLVPTLFFGRAYLWQLVTYMFLHANVLHIFFNMLFLWMMGSELERYWGSAEFLKFYLITGCGAGLVNVLVQPHSSIPTIGASGAIFGIIIAFALAFPERELLLYFFIRIKAKHFAILVGALELVALLLLPNAGIARFAHLGGLLVGYVYLKYDRLVYPLKKRVLRTQARLAERAELRQEERRDQMRGEIDRILDKISREGIGSLTDREKAFLEKQGGRKG
ncbi:MAG TPA: rhomboid family intramembrane serine protease [bacterium]|nr:rhomboid family intramembrane serine protease [bacterium]